MSLITLATTMAWRAERQDTLSMHNRGVPGADSHKIETYYSPKEEIEILCMTDEREDFEQHTGIKLTADVIDQESFTQLRKFLHAEYGLKDR